MTIRSKGRLRVSLVILCLAGAIGTWAILPIDDAVSRDLRSGDMPGDLTKAINLSEVFAHGLGALAIFACLVTVCVDKRRALWGAIVLTSVSGISANLAKGVVARIRPHSQASVHFDPEGRPAELRNKAEGNSTTLSDAEFVPLSFWDPRQRSFPSGHAATAWGLAIGLSLVFPRGSVFFAVFACLASLQRIVSGAHFLSDVVAGATIACFASLLLLSIPAIAGLFTPDE